MCALYNKYFNNAEWDKYTSYLLEIDDVLRKFAKKNKMFFSKFCYHEWPNRNLEYKNKFKNFFLRKTIAITYKEQLNNDVFYSLSVGIINSYGWKELLAFLPILANRVNRLPRFRWGKILKIFQAPINKDQLQNSLEEAKNILDNFDESLLQEVKYD